MAERLARESDTGPVIIAVCGKGGVGKTTISAMLTRLLMARRHARILAIDADPAVGLATSLGLPVKKTVDQIRNELVCEVADGLAGEPAALLQRLDYDVLAALAEERNLAFLAIGRPEGEGCYCQVNRLLKAIIAKLAASFDYVIIDGEAGIEQVNRRVMTAVTHLLLVSDASRKGTDVCRTILSLAASAIAYRRKAFIVNRVRPQEADFLSNLPRELKPAGQIPEAEEIRSMDMAGRSILDLPDCKALHALQCCLDTVLHI